MSDNNGWPDKPGVPMSDEIRAEIKAAAKALCHYSSGPIAANSCCPGIGRCEMKAAIAEITRLRAACDASEERERAIELRFWQTVDRDGLTGLSSDMWAALEQLVRDRAEFATLRKEALEEAAGRLEELHRQHKYNPKTGDGSEHDTGYYRALVEGAGWIRALAKGEGQ